MTREQETGLHVGIHQCVVFLGTRVHEVLVVPCPRVVDQDVESAKLFHRQRNALLRSRLVRTVPGMEYRSSTSHANQVAQLAQPLFAPRSHHDVRTLCSESKRSRPPNPGAGSCDKNCLSRKADRIRHDCMLLIMSGGKPANRLRKPIWMLPFRLCLPSTSAPNIAPIRRRRASPHWSRRAA